MFDANAVVIQNGKLLCISYLDNFLNVWEINHNAAWGTGEQFALAAMDFGRSAIDAVKYAKTRDYKSGGKVRSFKV